MVYSVRYIVHGIEYIVYGWYINIGILQNKSVFLGLCGSAAATRQSPFVVIGIGPIETSAGRLACGRRSRCDLAAGPQGMLGVSKDQESFRPPMYLYSGPYGLYWVVFEVS